MDTTHTIGNSKPSSLINGLSDIYRGQPTVADQITLSAYHTLLTYAEAAKILRVCQKTVENIARVRQEIPIVRVANKPFLRLSDIYAYMARGGSPSAESTEL